MNNILLIDPSGQTAYEKRSTWQLHKNPLIQQKAFTTPLHLATIAALTPDDINVDIWDEQVHGPIDDETQFREDYDLVGITGYDLHYDRVIELADIFKGKGPLLVAGGAGASSLPELYRDHFDIVFVGEAELTWPRFMEDYKKGSYLSEYKECELPDMANMPMPKWDSIADHIARDYMTASIQVSRGCPFTCEFCDVWQIFGRKVRLKPVERVGEEIKELEQLGAKSIFLCTDNFVGNKKYAKDLVRALIPLNQSFDAPLDFRTELTITVARDEELLEMMADANFSGALVGIESPNEGSLKETRKDHNLRFGDLTENCLKIMSYGIPIDGSMIVGFDNDSTEIFDQHVAFLQEACIPYPKSQLLKAKRGTELWDRLNGEGRLLDVIKQPGSNEKIASVSAANVIPENLTRFELLSGYHGMMKQIFDWENIEARLRGFVDNVKREPQVRRDDRGVVSFLKTNLSKMDTRSAEVIGHLLDYTESKAPFMSLTMAVLALRNYQDVINLPGLCEGLERQIEMEQLAYGSH